MALKHSHTVEAPQWPTEAIDLERAWVEYEPLADEFLIYFGGSPVPAISSPLNGPGFSDVAVMFGLGPNRESTGEIVGVQVIPMLLGAVQDQPSWAILTWGAMAGDFGDELLRERLPAFLDAVHDAFDRYWTPPPPMEEQLAAIERARHEREAASARDRTQDARSA